MEASEMVHAGYSEEVEQFLGRNPLFEMSYTELATVANEIFGEHHTYTFNAADTVVFGLIATAYEVFHEIVLLASNGFGRGAEARVRSMYEHVAVAAYLHKNPDQARRFIHFQWIERRKELRRAAEVLISLDAPGKDEFCQDIQLQLVELDKRIESAKLNFGRKFAGSWHDGMEKIAANLDWAHHHFYCYLLPNRHVHPSPAMLERRTVGEDQLYFEGGPDRDLADEAVRSGLMLLVLLLDVANKIGLPVREDQIKAAIDRLIESYRDRPNKHIL
jgi:hypothetical protein